MLVDLDTLKYISRSSGDMDMYKAVVSLEMKLQQKQSKERRSVDSLDETDRYHDWLSAHTQNQDPDQVVASPLPYRKWLKEAQCLNPQR